MQSQEGKYKTMGIIEIFLIGVGLSMDAFAVSVCKGLNMQKVNHIHAVIISIFFGGFQFLMPLVGWFLGTGFEKYIEKFDHWIAFILLLLIGGKMIIDIVRGEEQEIENQNEEKLDLKELVVMAVATSIDALAVGITMSCLLEKNSEVLPAALMIGVTTFAISYMGVVIGNHFGMKYKDRATLAGGIILILIGTKILLEHLGIIAI